MPDRSESNTAPVQRTAPVEETAPTTDPPVVPISDPGPHADAAVLARALRWRTIWPQVIAHAWADEDFRARLKENASAAILERFQYELSPELELTIEDAQTGTFDSTIEVVRDRWRDLPRMELTMYIPPAPELKDQAIALTHYSETGRTYPMTSA